MSIIKHVTLQKIVAHDFRYDPRMIPSGPKNTNIRQQLQAPYLVEDLIRYQRKWRKHVTKMEEKRLLLSAIQ